MPSGRRRTAGTPSRSMVTTWRPSTPPTWRRSATPAARRSSWPRRRRATGKAYGDTLVALGRWRGDVVALDGEVSNSTYAEEFKEQLPDRYFEMYISEQQMVAAAVGLQVRGWRPFASTFAAFLSRAYDFV